MKLNREVLGKLTNYYLQKLGGHRHTTGWLRHGVCPACGKDKKFGIDLAGDRTNCFSCGYHPKPLYLVMELEGLSSYNQVYNFLNAFEGADYLETPTKFLQEKVGELPVDYRLISFGDSHMGRTAQAYMKNRGFNLDKLMMKGVGYCVGGKYKGRIIIPFYEAGKLIYFNARQFMNISEDKFMNPTMDEFGIGKSLLMYNADCLHIYSRVRMMESAMNCLTWGDDAFGIGGKIASNYQITKVLASPVKEVSIILDDDAKWEAYQLSLRLSNHKRVKVVEMPKKKDVNDLGRKETLYIEKHTPWLTYRELYSKYLGIERPIHATA